MIQLDYVDRTRSTQTLPVVCMHCDSPTCAEVCPADAIKRTEDGVVQIARKPRCIACNNCVLACPFGVPKMNTRMNLMMKCDMLRPHLERPPTDVRIRVPQPGAGVWRPFGSKST
jgi:Fe-S-cluster-containing dehydrogenase component